MEEQNRNKRLFLCPGPSYGNRYRRIDLSKTFPDLEDGVRDPTVPSPTPPVKDPLHPYFVKVRPVFSPYSTQEVSPSVRVSPETERVPVCRNAPGKCRVCCLPVGVGPTVSRPSYLPSQKRLLSPKRVPWRRRCECRDPLWTPRRRLSHSLPRAPSTPTELLQVDLTLPGDP